jgi:hypothetical protein
MVRVVPKQGFGLRHAATKLDPILKASSMRTGKITIILFYVIDLH